jgi:hypothetical protein
LKTWPVADIFRFQNWVDITVFFGPANFLKVGLFSPKRLVTLLWAKTLSFRKAFTSWPNVLD